MDMAQSAAPAGAEQTQDFVIEVRRQGGKFFVSSEPIEAPAAESMEGETESPGQQADTVGEMLKLVMSIAKNNGATDDGQGEFMAGYNEPSEPA